MSEINVKIGGNSYKIGCEDGSEEKIANYAMEINKSIQEIGKDNVGSYLNTEHLLLLHCLLMHEKLEEKLNSDDKLFDGEVSDKMNLLATKISDLREILK